MAKVGEREPGQRVAVCQRDLFGDDSEEDDTFESQWPGPWRPGAWDLEKSKKVKKEEAVKEVKDFAPPAHCPTCLICAQEAAWHDVQHPKHVCEVCSTSWAFAFDLKWDCWACWSCCTAIIKKEEEDGEGDDEFIKSMEANISEQKRKRKTIETLDTPVKQKNNNEDFLQTCKAIRSQGVQVR